MTGQSLGLIEVYGYVAAIEAADSAVKSANVELAAVEKVKGGLVTVILSGDVGAVKAAVKSGEESAKRMGKHISSLVIPRPVDDVFHMILKPSTKIKEEQENISISKEESFSSVQSVMETEQKELQAEVLSEEAHEKEVLAENIASDLDQLTEGLEDMTLAELRKIARNLNMGTMTNKDIKLARKKELIEEITRFYERSGK